MNDDLAKDAERRLTPPEIVGDGIADDTKAIQYWIDEAAGNGKIFWLRNGIYRISAPLRISASAKIDNVRFLADLEHAIVVG